MSTEAGIDELLHPRFANAMIEPIWNRSHIACVEITMAESFGVEDRGHFYELDQLVVKLDPTTGTGVILDAHRADGPGGEPLLERPPTVHPYAPGSWGPVEGDGFVKGCGKWRGPWVQS